MAGGAKCGVGGDLLRASFVADGLEEVGGQQAPDYPAPIGFLDELENLELCFRSFRGYGNPCDRRYAASTRQVLTGSMTRRRIPKRASARGSSHETRIIALH
jgi:hypothetical protein